MAAAAPGHHAAGTAPGQWPGFWPRTVCRIPAPRAQRRRGSLYMDQRLTALAIMQDAPVIPVIVLNNVAHAVPMARSEEHTSELQSPCNLVCRLLLDKQ